MGNCKLPETFQQTGGTSVGNPYSIYQPFAGRSTGSGSDPLVTEYGFHGSSGNASDLLYSSHGRICTCKEKIYRTYDHLLLIVCAMALPKQVILIPLLREMSSLNMYNTIWAVIFPTVGWPFGVFLIKQFAEGIPGEMMEAARIDGASEWKTFSQIALPMIKPGIGALAIFTFINSWNDYFMQLIMLSSTDNLTISLGIAKLQAENATDFGLINGRCISGSSSDYCSIPDFPEILYQGNYHGCC